MGVGAAKRSFQGQTSLQMSQPKAQPSSCGASRPGSGPLCSMVRYAMHCVASSTRGSTSAPVGQASRHRVQVPQRSSSKGESGGKREVGEHGADEEKGARPGPNEHRVLADPSQAGALGQLALRHRAGVDVGMRDGRRARAARRPSRSRRDGSPDGSPRPRVLGDAGRPATAVGMVVVVEDDHDRRAAGTRICADPSAVRPAGAGSACAGVALGKPVVEPVGVRGGPGSVIPHARNPSSRDS